MASGQDEQPDRHKQGQRGWVVARPFGIPVYVSPYWFIIAGVFIVIYANDLSASLSGNRRYVVAAGFVVLLYLSVLVHELAHSVVARGYGLPVRRILLYPLGGVSEIEREAPGFRGGKSTSWRLPPCSRKSRTVKGSPSRPATTEADTGSEESRTTTGDLPSP